MAAKIWNSLMCLVFPDFCEICRTPLVKSEKCLCWSCLYKMPRTKFWEERGNELEQLFWGRVNIEHACALFFFRKGSIYRPLIHKLKYLGNYNIGVRLGEELGFSLSEAAIYNDIDLLVPVPLHPKKERKRGYNQSEYIAKGMSYAMNLPLEAGNLMRTHFTETQTRKTKAERWENVNSVFDVKNKSKFEDKHILLVDDVITTGSTLEACASVLLDNCNCKVSLAALGFASK